MIRNILRYITDVRYVNVYDPKSAFSVHKNSLVLIRLYNPSKGWSKFILATRIINSQGKLMENAGEFLNV